MGSGWKIRLLGGLLQGREVWVHEGSLTLAERGGDVCIPLSTNEKIVLCEKDGCLFVEARKSRIWVNGHRHRQESPLPASGVIEVAGIVLAFGAQDCDLTHYRIPPSYSRYGWLAAGLLLIVGTIGGSIIAGVTDNTATVSQPDRIRLLMQQSNMPDLKAYWKSDGSLQLTGYCPSAIQMQKLRARLSSMGVTYRDNVVCTDQMAHEVQDVLLQKGYSSVDVISTGVGNVVIRTDAQMDQRWRSVQAELAEISGLRHWQIENPVQFQSKAIITALLENNLAGLVNVTPVQQTFVISGILDAPQRRLLQQTLASLREQYPTLSLSYQGVAASGDGGKYLPAPVAGYVRMRRGSYLLLTNGERLQVGSRLPEGGEIVTLSHDAVSIVEHDSLINFPLKF